MQTKATQKHAVITGTTSGLGLHLLKALNEQNYFVSIINRNKEKTDRILEENDLKNVASYIADLAELKSVHSVAQEILSLKVPIDLLINNAGCLTSGRKVSNEGWEYCMCINYFAPFLFTNMLLPLLSLEENSYVVNVNSSAHSRQNININKLNDYSGFQAYATSKLANALFTIELSNRIKSKLTTIAFDPGPMSSGFGGNLSTGFKFFMQIVKPLLPSPQKVSNDLLKILSMKAEIQNGGYYLRSGLSKFGISKAVKLNSSSLWESTENLLKEKIPEIMKWNLT